MSDKRDALRAWLDLLTTSNAIKKSVDTSLRAEFGLSISRFDVLAALDRAGPEGLRAGELSQRLMVTEGNTTQVTAPLMKDGLVRRKAGSEDRRVAIFQLTKKGEKLFKKMAEAHRQWVAEAFNDLSEPQLLALRKLLSRIKLPPAAEPQRKDAA